MTHHTFTAKAIETIRAIPAGRVATYGQLARMAGNPRGARQIVRILHTYSGKEALPWHRVINREGRIALKTPRDCDEQRRMLEMEGVVFDASGAIMLERFLWSGHAS